MNFGDLNRWSNALLACALVLASMYGITLAATLDQRFRFLALAGFGGLIASTGIGALGNPWRWEVSALTLLTGLALVSTLIFVRRELRTRRRDDP